MLQNKDISTPPLEQTNSLRVENIRPFESFNGDISDAALYYGNDQYRQGGDIATIEAEQKKLLSHCKESGQKLEAWEWQHLTKATRDQALAMDLVDHSSYGTENFPKEAFERIRDGYTDSDLERLSSFTIHGPSRDAIIAEQRTLLDRVEGSGYKLPAWGVQHLDPTLIQRGVQLVDPQSYGTEYFSKEGFANIQQISSDTYGVRMGRLLEEGATTHQVKEELGKYLQSVSDAHMKAHPELTEAYKTGDYSAFQRRYEFSRLALPSLRNTAND